MQQGGEDARMSKKILDLARDQQDEIAREMGDEMGDDDEDEDEDDEEAGSRAEA